MQPMAMAPPPTKRKGGVAIGLGIALIVFGIVGGIGGAVLGFRNLQDRIDELQRVPLAGGGELRLVESGTYKVYVERPFKSTAGAILVIRGPQGERFSPRGDGVSETYDIGGRHGRKIGKFYASQPGTYTFSSPAGGEVSGQIAVGRRSPIGAFGAVIGPILLAVLAGVVGIILIVIGAVRRSGSKRSPAGGYPGGGAWAPPSAMPPGPGGWGAPAPTAAAGWTPPPGQAWTPPQGPGPPPPPAGPAWAPPQTGGDTTWNPPPR